LKERFDRSRVEFLMRLRWWDIALDDLQNLAYMFGTQEWEVPAETSTMGR
jgi:hypothetical protein